MHTVEQIEKMFAEMGLGTELKRAHLLRFNQVPQESPKSQLTFIMATNNTTEEEAENGQLERDPK